MIFDINYLIFMVPAFLLMAATSWYVKAAYRKWGRVPASSRLTGAQAAQKLLSTASYTTADGRSLRHVRILGIGGKLTDHYDPRDKTLKLSPEVAEGSSVAALAIAAHEIGHAVQDSEKYIPMRLRSALVPAVNIGSNLGWILIILGLVMHYTQLAWLGVFAFSAGAVFALCTLPVEFNASARAKEMLVQSGLILSEEEKRGVSNVLNAAALTYVAGLVTAVMQLLYYVMLVGGMGDRRRT